MRQIWRDIVLSILMLVFVSCPAFAQFIPFSHDTRNVLEGNWQSCRQSDPGEIGSHYAEMIYDHYVLGVPKFEVHLGPYHEFGIFKGVHDDHRDHDAPTNLLKPYLVEQVSNNAKHRWEIPSLNLAFTVTLSGGSRGDCESWFILLEPLQKKTTSDF